MSGLPAGVKVEVEFTPGTWSDVTGDVNGQLQIHVGRTSPGTAPDPSTCSLTLDNPDGRYTPGREVLLGGGPAPHYPNVKVGKRIRVSCTAGTRFVGEVKSWLPQLNSAGIGVCAVQAVDRLQQMARVTLDSAISREVLRDQPFAYWPLTDAAGNPAAANIADPRVPDLVPEGAPTGELGQSGVPGNGSGVSFSGDGSYYFAAIFNLPDSAYDSTAFECWALLDSDSVTAYYEPFAWINYPDIPPFVAVFSLSPSQVALMVGQNVAVQITGSAQVFDGQWHHHAATFTKVGTSGQWSYYIDGILVGTRTDATTTLDSLRMNMRIGDFEDKISMGHVAVYTHALTSDRVAVHARAGQSWPRETVRDRLVRFLGEAGVDPAETDLDASSVVLDSYAQFGQSVLEACQAAVASEGGGAVLYVRNGVVVFRGRGFRPRQTTPALTIDAAADGDGSAGQPELSTDTLVNSQTVQRANVNGSDAPVTYSDAESIDQYQERDGATVDSYAIQASDRRLLAGYLVAAGSRPGLRFNQFGLDLFTAQNDLMAHVAAVQIGSRLRATNLHGAISPASQVDGFVEGWTETIAVDTYTITFDTSPADLPAFGVWDDPAYGRWQGDGLTLAAPVTAGAATMQVANSELPLTTSAAAYPLRLAIGAEVVTVTAAPASSSSPQTVPITRAGDGTAAAPHAAGTPVSVHPEPCWAL